MASSTGYDGAIQPTVGHFTKEQRARLEAFTFARKLLQSNTLGRPPHLSELMEVSDYIILGEPR